MGEHQGLHLHFGLLRDQIGTAACAQDRVQHTGERPSAKAARKPVNLLQAAQQANLDGVDGNVRTQCRELSIQHGNLYGVKRADITGVLDGQRRHKGKRVNLSVANRLDIGVDAGASTGVKPRATQNTFHRIIHTGH